MNIFLSWSGERSKQVAVALKDWLPLIVHNVDPWFSVRDIDAGDRWSVEIASKLADSNFGVLCLTPDNLDAAWLHFEAGALSKSVTEGAVVPYVLDLELSQIPQGPLSQFQAKKADRDGTFALIETLSNLSKSGRTDAQLRELFDSLWPKLQDKLTKIPSVSPRERPNRPQGDILEELVAVSRESSTRLERIETGLAQVGLSPSTRNEPISDADVVEAFARIHYLRRDELEANASDLRRKLADVGIRTKNQLFQLVGAKDVFEWLEALYNKELLRPVEAPLDPSAVATWGGMLLANRMSEKIKQHITKLILNCDEYRQKHPEAR